MNGDMKTAHKLGTLTWRISDLEPLKIVNIVLANAMLDDKTTHKVAQITLHAKSRQECYFF